MSLALPTCLSMRIKMDKLEWWKLKKSFCFSIEWITQRISISRGYFPKFTNWLNIKIEIVQKVYELPSCPFVGMIPWWESFWEKISLVTHILFELCLFWYVAHSQILGNTLYSKSFKKKNVLNWIGQINSPMSNLRFYKYG